MSSYYPSFSCVTPNGVKYNSYKDKHLIVTHFESGDEGEMDTFLGMEPIYADNAYGTRRFDYGAKYNNVAVIRISVMKANGKDFAVAEVRDFLKWTTGSRVVSYLDLSDIVDNEEIVKASFLGRVTAVYQQKLDARTIGLVVEHTSVSPYAYSPVQYFNCSFNQDLLVDEDGVLIQKEDLMTINESGVLSNGTNATFDIINNGTLCIGNSTYLTIYNDTDDLSDYVYMDTKFIGENSNHLVIKNQTLYEQSNKMDGLTEITGMYSDEVITLSSGQFITSSYGNKFGNNFNFIWPKLLPGENNFIVSGSGEGTVEFSYRYPIKIGDCAMDVNVSGGGLCCGDCPSDSTSGHITWDDIIGKPNTIRGYGITDAYTIPEVDSKLDNIDMNIDENELNQMLKDVLE